ncbi:SusC/RagA family TonB-linked outer membrane protein [Flammeovirga yaeyamensis]|uniref:SusC/RagA family TonB-linked outer membrane protein n=1 Tax=Flammeovirga yaeyamensis TaxID=367791 RepID=A0AAX1N2Y0_9BACT|nr:SusC/RagA family TonB-linked outer membrane protein [Flammeovirga yaeyamensis]MBB3701055.1 TonB-linked SusC/RagA family outer membrane protein [Flammeovirga yaeyamensis]NMF38113.1 SusC/RagA family TonB-linked outer membrane protein [Flammeovirga yaeyamensis]QWG01884.1 SusC/RagA family TonB-linked outer membrane protein [Flammeovirga yaeyamensis]
MYKRLLSLLVLTLAFCVSALAQERTVTGQVTEAGLPLPGVTVLVKGTSKGTITNVDGKYSISTTSESTLIYSFVGYASQEIPVGTKSEINVSLEQDAEQLDEVVVTALGQQTDKKSIGYAFQEVDTETLQQTGNPGLAGALQGKIAGVDIKPSSGMPGASTQINIRGARSFTGNNAPLYVIDGMPISSNPDFSTGSSVTGTDIANRAVDIDPNDIESINVLKGQAAAALYGIRASNGVIIITTKSGKGSKGKPVVKVSNFTSFEQVSRSPEYQTTYAQGGGGVFNPYTSISWGPKISDLPNDPTFGGNGQGHEGMYKVPQLEEAGLNPWVKPQAYDNFNDYFQTGHTINTSANISQATEKVNYSIGLTNTSQKGIALNTGMERWNVKGRFDASLNDKFSTGVSANFVKTDIDKLSAGNDAALAGVYAAPVSYNLKGNPSALPSDPYSQIYYRNLTFDNPYWIADHNVFNEVSNRFFGNTYVQYDTKLRSNMNLKVKYQLGVDAYTTHYQDIYEFGSGGSTGNINNYGITNQTINSLLTVNYDWEITDKLKLSAVLGKELNDSRRKTYDQMGYGFNFGGWKHIDNTRTQTSSESQFGNRTVGFFGSASLSYDNILFATVTGRNDYVSTMPEGARSFFYPSVSLSWVVSEMDFMDQMDKVSMLKLRGSFAQVGQAGQYYENFYNIPSYGGGWWNSLYPVTYPMNGLSAYTRSSTIYDPQLQPQNTLSYEAGADLGFFNDRIYLSYTYSRQNVSDQIFPVPLASSTGYSSMITNGGRLHTDAHEITLTLVPVETKDLTWDVNFNYSRIVSYVDELAEGVESIFLGGFVNPQVRAGVGYAYPVIYGTKYARDDEGRILVDENPNSASYGMPYSDGEGIIGDVMPKFILGFNTNVRYKNWNLGAVLDWKHGGQMYHGSNNLLNLYGVGKDTENRTDPFVWPGYKENGQPNDIARGGEGDEGAYFQRYYGVEGSIDEGAIYDNSFVKLRELSLGYSFPKKFIKGTTDVRLSAFARNILIWTELPNFDPESSQGNNNMSGAFERFSLPNTSSFGFGVDLTF